jgi:glycosyltransferase involved in cell wall biosynthesis
MNVCMISYSFYESDNRVMRYAEALAGRGDSVEIFSLRQEGESREELVNGVRVFQIQARQKNEKKKISYLLRILLFFFRALMAVSTRHMRRRYSVIHVHSVPDFLVFAAAVPRLTGCKVILDIHDLLPELYATKFGCGPDSLTFSTLQRVERISCAFANHVIVPNHIWQGKLIARSVEASKCSVFMNYPDPAIFRPQGRAPSDGKFLIVYPGSLNSHQGLDIAIRAFQKVSAEFPNCEFHIYGEGPAKDALILLTDELKLSGKVMFHAPVPLRQIAAIMENADLGIVAKRNDSFGDEAFSTKTLEFMMMGVPIVLAETTVDRYYFNDDVVSFFPNGNVAELASCILKLVSDPAQRAEQVVRARRFVAAYSWDAKKQEYLTLVDKLAMAGGPVEHLAPSSL